MNYAGKFDAAVSPHGPGSPSHSYVHTDSFASHAPADAIVVPDADLLFGGAFRRSGADLILSKDGRDYVVHDYFRGDKHVALASHDGAHLTGDIVNAVTHLRKIRSEIRRLTTLDDAELATAAKELQAPLHLVRQIAADGRLPVVLFCAGGIATPADAALVMQLGAEGVFVGSGIFKSEDPERRARSIVEATTHYQDPARVAAASTGLGRPMMSLETSKLEAEQLLAPRGW